MNDFSKLASDKLIRNIEAVKSQKKIADSYYDFSVNPKSGANLTSIADKGIQAGILNNFQQIMDSDQAMATHASNYGPYVMEVWPVVTAWYPEFPLKDLISVQDMDKPLAYLFFSRLLVARGKGNQAYGDIVETPTGMRVLKGKYPTGEIVGETISSEEFSFDADAKTTSALLAYCPLNLNANLEYTDKIKVAIKVGDTTTNYYYSSVSGTTITLGTKSEGVVTPVVGFTLDTQTGLLTYPEDSGAVESSVDSIVVNYVWNVDYATVENIQKVKEDIEMLPMQAKERALAMEWTLFSEYLKKSQFGVDIREENTKRILNLLYQYQVRYILDELFDYAEGEAQTLTIPSNTTMSVDVKAQTVIQQLKLIATKIEIASGRMEGNRIVCGKNFKSFVESLPNIWFTPVAQPSGFSAPREIGTFAGTFKVYYDQMRADGEAFMTYRGSEWYDAAYYLGVFMPIVPTDAVALGVTDRKSVV